MNKAFTLIELLISIAILAVIASGVIIAINPLSKVNKAKDTKTKSDVAQIASAFNTFYTVNGYYPSTIADLVTNGELKAIPSPVTGYAVYSIRIFPAGCTTALKNCVNISIYGSIKSPDTVGNAIWCYKTSLNTALEVLNMSACTQF